MGLLRRVARARLAGQVIRRLRRAGLTDARYDRHGFQVRFTATGDDVPTIVELAPLLAGRGRKRREMVDSYVAGLLPAQALPRTWAKVRPLLRPVLRGGTPGAPLRRPVLPFLSEFVVIDQPDTMAYVAPEQPAGWGVSAEEVFAAARANLSGAVLQGTATAPVVVRFVDDGDAYWTSHLLLEHWLGRLADQVGGVPVAFAPERGTLLVTADGSDHLRGLFAQAEEIYARSSRPITPMAYASDANGCTVPYAAPPGHPLHRTVQRAERVLAVQEYARQAAHLEEARAAAAAASEATTPTDEATTAAGEGKATTAAAEATPVGAETTPVAAEATPVGAEGMPVAGGGMKTAGKATTVAGEARKAGRRATTAPSRATKAAGRAAAAEPDAYVGLIAELRLVGSDSTGWRTRALWERDEPVLLPTADEVRMGDEICPWADMAAHLSVVPGLDPVRWTAARWPTGRRAS